MGVSAVWFLFRTAMAGWGVGWVVRRWRRPKDEPLLDAFVLDTSIGLGLLSLVFFAMAALHLLSGPGTARSLPFFVLMSAVLLWLLTGASDVVPSVFDWFKRKQWPKLGTVVWVLLFICLALVVLIPALAPPVGSDWDSLAYHLAVPKLYLQHHGFYYIDFMSHSNFPMLVEMLYLPALAKDSPAGAKLVHYLYGVLLVLAVVMLVRKHFSARGAPLAALAIAGMPIVMWEATTAYIDLATALYTVVAVYLLLDYLDKPELRSLVWCGVAAGFAASTKMTGLALIPMLAVWLVVDRLFAGRGIKDLSPGPSPGKGGEQKAGAETGHYGRIVKHALVLCGVGLLVCSPWYIKGLIYTGNPVYPFFYSIFGGKDWTQELAQGYAALQAKFGMGHDFASFALLPVDLTFFSEKFYDRPGLFVGPILLVAAPLLMFARNWPRKLKGLVVFFLAQMVIWFMLTQQSRYLIPAFAILAVIIAAVAHTEERFRITRVALYAVFGATALFGILTLSFGVIAALPVVLGHQTTDTYLHYNLPVYDAQKWINERTSGRAKIALFGDTRGYYLDRDYVWADWGHNKRFTRKYGSASEFARYLKSQGITHAMVNFRTPGLRSENEATGTYRMIYRAIQDGRFCQVFPRTGERSPTRVFEVR